MPGNGRTLADYEREWHADADAAAKAFAEIEPLIERIDGVIREGGWLGEA